MRLVLATLLFLLGPPALAQKAGEPGRFDYYVLALSWSPTWCGTKAGRTDTGQCAPGRRFGFVLHGLWPQYAGGGYPVECAPSRPVPDAVVDAMLPLMPSRTLIQHEWRKHGTCTGFDPAEFFATAEAARDRVKVPAPLADPARPMILPPREVERLFAEANPGLGVDTVAVTCRGRRVAEVRVCLDRKLSFRPCGPDVRDRCTGEALFPAAR